MIGQVGSILGSYSINIGTMQVGRAAIGGEAIMILTLDKKIEQEVTHALHSISGLEDVQILELSYEEELSVEKALHL